ncbi:MAG: RNA degradosome polyphosphate kinase, partial [Pseudomonadota bacterium]
MTNADFLKGDLPQPQSLPELGAGDPKRFFNRELSWLAFNWRVLEEAENPNVPLLERVRFLSISGSNLDEFYTVRVAGLRGLVREGVTRASADGMSPSEQLLKIDTGARALMERQQTCWTALKAEMATVGLMILGADDLTKQDKADLEVVFMDQVFPILTPLAIDPAHPFPFISNEGFALALELRRTKDGAPLQALLPIPSQIDRFIRLSNGPGGQVRFLALEDLLEVFFDRMFPGYEITGRLTFRVLRDSDLEVEEEAEDLVREFETALKRRRRGE